ncbi:MAG: hypothetical protein WA089_16895, partial [Anaerolineae bacterium]
LEPGDVTTYAGLPVTTVARTISDLAASGLPEELIWQAVLEALRRTLTTQEQLRAMAGRRSGRAYRLIEQILTP